MNQSLPNIMVSSLDYKVLTDITKASTSDSYYMVGKLKDELDRAEVVSADAIPADLVTLYSKVEYQNIQSGKTNVVEVTMPDDADIERRRVSMLAPIGAALLGLRVGQQIEWPLPNGRIGEFYVKRVIQKPRPETVVKGRTPDAS